MGEFFDFDFEDNFLNFQIPADNYDVTNNYYFSDGSGGYDWRDILGATGSFVDLFEEYDLVNTWNEDALNGTASATGGILTIDSGASEDDYYNAYTVYQTSDTLRNIRKVTWEVRAKRNNGAVYDFLLFMGLGGGSIGSAFYDNVKVPTNGVMVANSYADIDKVKMMEIWGEEPHGETADFASTNNTWTTFKIVLYDAAYPYAKFYINGSLKATLTMVKTDLRDQNIYGFFGTNTVDGAGNDCVLDVEYITIKEG